MKCFIFINISALEVFIKYVDIAGTITTCATIRTILPQSLPDALPVSTINGISNSEIADCLSDLGAATGWTNDQALAILTASICLFQSYIILIVFTYLKKKKHLEVVHMLLCARILKLDIFVNNCKFY